KDAANNSSSKTFKVTVADKTAPVITVPANITVPSTGASGAAVTYTANATDAVGVTSFGCTPASGSTFPNGTTTVNCNAADAAGNSSSKSFTVTVQNAGAPTVTVPANITAEATSSSGAAVTYTATASDAVDGPLTPTCAPTSGSTFPLGPTT